MNRPQSGHRVARRLVTITAVVVLTGGCLWFTWGKGYYDAMQPTITRQQAVDHIHGLINQVVAQLPSGARLESAGHSSGSPCDDPTDGGPKGRVFVEYDYWIKDLHHEDYPRYFDSVESNWKDRDYRLLRDTQTPPSRDLVYSDPKGFRIALKTSGDGRHLYIRSQSPCIWPNGTPEPNSG